MKTLVKIKCANCGKELFRQPNRIKNTKNHFCDFKCYGQWQSRNRTGINNFFYKRIKIKCKNCGAEIFREPYLVEGSKYHFCSLECYRKWKRDYCIGINNPDWKSIKVKCDNCKKEFFIEPNRLERSKRHFCGVTCMQEFLKGSNAPGWQNGASFEPYSSDWTNALKKFIRRRDNFKCQLCGAPQEEFSKALPVHHIDYNKKNSRKENLITLCPTCHKKTNTNRDYWISLFKIKIREIYPEIICQEVNHDSIPT